MSSTLDQAGWLPAVGGQRLVPPPDPVAREYVRLALRLDQHVPGLVDGYFGPAELKAQVDTEQLRSPARLRDDADALRARLHDEVDVDERRDWLDVQLVALRTQAAVLAGDDIGYLELVERCFDHAPARRPDSWFAAATEALHGWLPGAAALADRLDAWDKQFEVPAERLQPVLEWLVARFRDRAEKTFGLPEGEDLRLSLVQGQPWSAYNWFDGGRRSRIDVNTDLPHRAGSLLKTMAHEGYPGHHLEHAWKEADLVEAQGQLESSILLINTPECLISEGLANLGERFAVPPDEAVGLLVEVYELAGLPLARDPAAARAAAEQAEAMQPHRDALGAVNGNAAIMRHAVGRSHDEVAAYLRDVGGLPDARAQQALGFIEHPLWRTYVFVYFEGEALLRRWVEAVPAADQAARFGRLLHEQLTPAAVRSPD